MQSNLLRKSLSDLLLLRIDSIIYMRCYLLFLLVLICFQSTVVAAITDSNSKQDKYKDIQITQRDFLNFCREVTQDESLFARFKSIPIYSAFSTDIPVQNGPPCLQYLLAYDPILITYINALKRNDKLGNPTLYPYSCGICSPAQLHHMKVVATLRERFGNLRSLHIVEIGGNEGGLCHTLAATTGFASYTKIDLVEMNGLAKKCLAVCGIKKVRFNDMDHLPVSGTYDLLILDETFCLFDRYQQEKLIHQLIPASKRGYLLLGPTRAVPEGLTVEDALHVLCEGDAKGEVGVDENTVTSVKTVISWSQKGNFTSQHQKKPSLRSTGNVLTYNFSGGRLGDCLVSYLHAKWLAYKYDLPLAYIPFKFSEEFQLSRIEKKKNPKTEFVDRLILKREEELFHCRNTLFVVPYFPDCKWDFYNSHFEEKIIPFSIGWDNEGFREQARRCLTLKSQPNLVPLPKDYITIGVHVRRGGGFDSKMSYKLFPLKFPPDAFYIDCLKQIAAIFRDRPIYVYIVTDDQNPVAIRNKFEEALANPQMTFDCRFEGNDYKASMLDDFYLLQQFDCLIYSQSNFSNIASKLGHYKLLISPVWMEKVSQHESVISKVEILFNH